MGRSRRSAKQAGATFERSIADYMKDRLDNEHIDRQVKTGSKDQGDIRGVKHLGQKIVIECKNYGGRIQAGPWVDEANIEMGNAEAGVGMVVAKRKGTTKPGDQFVLMTVDDFIALITGEPRDQV